MIANAKSREVNASVTLEQTGCGGLTVWLGSPNRSVNVLDTEMLEGLESAVEAIAADAALYRWVVFRSRKPDCFLAGADVAAIASLTEESEVGTILERGQTLMSSIEQLALPTLAVIDGACMGGGMELALACNYRVATESKKTRMALPEVKLGLLPAWGGTQRLPQLIGLRSALEMMLTGKSLSSRRALRLGLIDSVLSGDNLELELEQRMSGRSIPRGRAVAMG